MQTVKRKAQQLEGPDCTGLLIDVGSDEGDHFQAFQARFDTEIGKLDWRGAPRNLKHVFVCWTSFSTGSPASWIHLVNPQANVGGPDGFDEFKSQVFPMELPMMAIEEKNAYDQ